MRTLRALAYLLGGFAAAVFGVLVILWDYDLYVAGGCFCLASVLVCRGSLLWVDRPGWW